MGPTTQEVREFLEGIKTQFSAHDGKKSSSEFAEHLRDAVRAQPELAIESALTCVESDKIGGKGGREIALALAAAYQLALDDDSLMKAVHRELDRAGLAAPELTGHKERVAHGAWEDTIVNISIYKDELDKCDIYDFIKLFSYSASSARAEVATKRGRFMLTFAAVNEDPRASWRIPEVRRFIHAIAQEMPYFPYYLVPEPRAGQFLVYFGSLSDEGAWVDEFNLDLTHRSVIRGILNALEAVRELCRHVEEDPAMICGSILEAVPEPMRAIYLREKRQGESG